MQASNSGLFCACAGSAIATGSTAARKKVLGMLPPPHEGEGENARAACAVRAFAMCRWISR
jgi:hypothetical protein